MTVATTNITSGPYTGTGAFDEVSYDFRVEDKTQLSVWETDDVGVKTLLAVDTDYTVAGVGVDGGGQITRVAGNLPTDYIWYIRSNYADTQGTSFPSQGAFDAEIHEAALDKRTFVSQQQEDLFRRSIRLDNSDESVETVDMTIPVIATRASQYLGFDASGNLITIAGVAGAVTVSSFMETLLDDNDIETALGTLGLSIGADAASAGTLTLGVGNYFDITGITTITAIGTKFIGAQAILQFDGILALTHHAANLILPGGAKITTAAGDHAYMVEYDTGKWRCVGYFRANGYPINLTNMQLVTPTLVTPTLVTPIMSGAISGVLEAGDGIQTDGSTVLKTKVVPIGTWDMNANESRNVNVGIPYNDIRSISAIIKHDTGTINHDINYDNGNGTAGFANGIACNTTFVILSRVTEGAFDNIAFELTSVTIDNAAAVDKGDGLVGIPITGHVFSAKDNTTIASTTNYDGNYDIVSQTANEIVIVATYVAETFAGTETASWSRGWVTITYIA